LDKLRQGEVPTADELVALEIIIRLLRPVVFTHDGVLDDLPDRADQNLQPQELKDLWSTFRDKVRPLVGSIGRVETKSGTHVGTGFLVAEGVLATNRHVLGILTFGAEVLAPGGARIVYNKSKTRPTHRSILPQSKALLQFIPTWIWCCLAWPSRGDRL